MLGVRSERFPIGVATMLSLPVGLLNRTSFNEQKPHFVYIGMEESACLAIMTVDNLYIIIFYLLLSMIVMIFLSNSKLIYDKIKTKIQNYGSLFLSSLTNIKYNLINIGYSISYIYMI